MIPNIESFGKKFRRSRACAPNVSVHVMCRWKLLDDPVDLRKWPKGQSARAWLQNPPKLVRELNSCHFKCQKLIFKPAVLHNHRCNVRSASGLPTMRHSGDTVGPIVLVFNSWRYNIAHIPTTFRAPCRSLLQFGSLQSHRSSPTCSVTNRHDSPAHEDKFS